MRIRHSTKQVQFTIKYTHYTQYTDGLSNGFPLTNETKNSGQQNLIVSFV